MRKSLEAVRVLAGRQRSAQTDPRRVEDPGRFLLDSGLLFEINRKILHPLGMALEAVVEDDGLSRIGGLWDYRSDPEGILYDDTTFAEGRGKFDLFMASFGQRKLAERQVACGFIVQGEEHP